MNESEKSETEERYRRAYAHLNNRPAEVIEFPKRQGAENPSALKENLADLREAVAKLSQQFNKVHLADFPVVNCKELARMLGKSEGTIRRWTDERRISAYKIPTGGQKFTYLYNLRRLESEFNEDYLQEAEV